MSTLLLPPPDVSVFLYATGYKPGLTQTPSPNAPVHGVDTHLDRLQMFAGFSEHVKPIDNSTVVVDPASVALHRARSAEAVGRCSDHSLLRAPLAGKVGTQMKSAIRCS